MGLEELLNSLRKNEQTQIEDIWQQARNEADSIRRQTAEAISRISEEHAEQLAAACQKSVRTIFAESQIKAREKRLLAYLDLDKALRAAAEKQLPLIQENNREDLFELLVGELPHAQWEKIAVSPTDLELATKFFDKNIIYADTNISGGLLAFCGDGKIVIDNTLEKRLERKWSQILPELIRRIEKIYEESGSAEKTG